MAQDRTTLTPMPEMPGPEEAWEMVRARVRSLPGGQGWEEHPRVREAALSTLARTITGRHGWTAELLGNAALFYGNTSVPYLVMDLLIPLCDWWAENARAAVLDCPPPENPRYPAVNRNGRSRMIRTLREGYNRWDTFLFDDEDFGNLNLAMAFSFRAQAKAQDTVWPFAPPGLIEPMARALKRAMGQQEFFPEGGGPTRRASPWPAREREGRRSWKNRRTYEDWSGRSPEERGVLVKRTPTPLGDAGG